MSQKGNAALLLLLVVVLFGLVLYFLYSRGMLTLPGLQSTTQQAAQPAGYQNPFADSNSTAVSTSASADNSSYSNPFAAASSQNPFENLK